MSNTDTILAFDTLNDPPGIEIIDRLEQLRYQIHTSEAVSPTPISPDEFIFPVGKGVRLRANKITLPDGVTIIVRDEGGEMLDDVDHLDSLSLEEGSYILDLSSQIKTYINIDGSVDITTGLLETEIEFDDPATVDIGFRSRHSRPAATVTTSSDPEEMIQAVSTFGSALQSTSPERSFPTLRGHPPTIELGSSLSIPDQIDTPETGINIQIPLEQEYIFPIATLAYYLGADVVPGESPQLVTENGFEYPLTDSEGFESGVEKTLKQLFLLDCITRTEGSYNILLHERSVLEENLDFDFERLYELPISERTEEYLSVPYDLVAPHIPKWRLTVNVEAISNTVEQLPFVVDDLAIIQTKEHRQTSSSTLTSQSSAEVRRESTPFTRSTANDFISSDQTRSTTGQSEEQEYIQLGSSDSLEQAWIGSGVPIGASKLTTDAFYNRLNRDVEAGDISITIVLNDQRMNDETDIVADVYGDREDLPFNVTVCRALSVEELDEQLRNECDFLHYIGHIDTDGFECVDGKLGVGEVDETGVNSFLLNACSSYQQGLNLIEAGAIGGIVTLTDIINSEAVSIGETIARLLNSGFPLRSALSIARKESVIGGQYIVVGDGGMTVTQAPSRVPNLLDITSKDNTYEVDIMTYSTDISGLGTIYSPFLDDVEEFFLISGRIGSFDVSEEELREFLDMEEVPVRIDGDTIYWSSSLSQNPNQL